MMNAEEAKEARHSLVWDSICKEIDFRISSIEVKLRNCTPEDLTCYQRDLKRWEEFRKLPDDVIERES